MLKAYNLCVFRLDFILTQNTGKIQQNLTLKDLAVKIRTLTQFAFKHLDLVPGKNLWKLLENFHFFGNNVLMEIL